MSETALQTININSHDLSLKEVNGQRVVTFKDVDELHERPDGTARRNFNTNKEHFIENEDYYRISANEIRSQNILTLDQRQTQDIVFLTEFGYLMLVKSFTDKLAWQVQRQLVNGYFRAKNNTTNIVLYSQEKFNELCTLVQDQSKQISDQWNEIETLNRVYEDCLTTDNMDKIQNAFYHVNEAINELKAINTESSTQSTYSTHRPVGKALIHSIIKPLAEFRQDITKGYNMTFRVVYSAMGIKGWDRRLTRYANEHKNKNKPSKMTLLLNDEKLLSLFEETVNRLLVKSSTQEV